MGFMLLGVDAFIHTLLHYVDSAQHLGYWTPVTGFNIAELMNQPGKYWLYPLWILGSPVTLR